MTARIARRQRAASTASASRSSIPQRRSRRTAIRVQDARDGKFIGSEIPDDLQRQWIQGTGPAARPHASVEQSMRNIAYALLSGADGWMFDGEDALGQIVDDVARQPAQPEAGHPRIPVFLTVAEQVAREMNAWAEGFLGRGSSTTGGASSQFTTKIFRARGLHLDDRHVRQRTAAASRRRSSTRCSSS